MQTQAVKAVISKAMPSHFDTFNKKEFKQHKLEKSALDAIPYPWILLGTLKHKLSNT